MHQFKTSRTSSTFFGAIFLTHLFSGCAGKLLQKNRESGLTSQSTSEIIPEYDLTFGPPPAVGARCGGLKPDGQIEQPWNLTSGTNTGDFFHSDKLCSFFGSDGNISLTAGLTFGTNKAYQKMDPNYLAKDFAECNVAGQVSAKNLQFTGKFCGAKATFTLPFDLKADPANKYTEKLRPICVNNKWTCASGLNLANAMYETEGKLSANTGPQPVELFRVPLAGVGSPLLFGRAKWALNCTAQTIAAGGASITAKFTDVANPPLQGISKNQKKCYSTTYTANISPSVRGQCIAKTPLEKINSEASVTGALDINIDNTIYGDVVDPLYNVKCSEKNNINMHGNASLTAKFMHSDLINEIGWVLRCEQEFSSGSRLFCKRISGKYRFNTDIMEDLETEMVEFFDKLKQLKQLPKKWLLDAWNYNYRGIGIFDDLQKNMTPWQEFKSSSIDATFNLSNGDLAGMRPWIGVSSGITATQSVVFSDLTPGTVYSLKVYPASASSTTAVYTATSNDTGALMIGGKKWNSPTLGTYSSRYSWKVSFKALSTQASIKLSPATTNTTNFIYFDFVEPSIDLEFADDYYQVGDLELADSAVTWDEFKSPKLAETYTFGVSSLISVRPWIGNSSGNIATQTFQFNNLIPNKSYMMRVYPSSISAMTAEFSASITSGTGQIAGGSSYRAPAAGYITEPMPWLIMFKSDTPTLQIKLGSNNPGDFLYFDYIDADKP